MSLESSSKKDLASLSLKELRELARDRAVPGRSRMQRDELIAALSRARRPKPAATAARTSGTTRTAGGTSARPPVSRRGPQQKTPGRAGGTATATAAATATTTRTTTRTATEVEVCLTAIDPRQLFVSWECRPSTLASERARLKDAAAEAVVSVRDVTLIEFDAERDFGRLDLTVADGDRKRYVSGLFPGRSYRAYFGLRSHDRFVVLGRSPAVETPAERGSPVGEELEVRVRGAGGGPWSPRADTPAPAPARADTSPVVTQAWEIVSEPVFAAEASVEDPWDLASPAAWNVASPETAAAGTRETPARGEVDIPGRSGLRAAIGDSLRVDAPRQNHGRTGPGVATATVSSARVLSAPSGVDLAPSSAGAPGLAPGRGAAGLAPSSAALLGLEPLVEVSPFPDLAADEGERVTRLELGADLIVYGRTEPDTVVVIDGVRVPVRPDGTFDVRFALNHIAR